MNSVQPSISRIYSHNSRYCKKINSFVYIFSRFSVNYQIIVLAWNLKMIKQMPYLLFILTVLWYSLNSSSASIIRGKNSFDDESNVPFGQSDAHFHTYHQSLTIQRKLDHVSVINLVNL